MNADNKAPVSSTSGPVAGGAQVASLKPNSSKAKKEPAVSPRQGNMPPKIEEEQEPPHDTVLPA
jgi:hypothetical protein